MRTHPVDKLLERHCYKSVAGLLQLARFYVCRFRILNAKDCDNLNLTFKDCLFKFVNL